MSYRVPPSLDDVDTTLPLEAPRWFILRVVGGRETRALLGLRELLRARKLGCYLPRETKWRRGGGPKSRSRRALVPGYMFVEATPDLFHVIRHVDGVLGFLCLAGGDPMRAPMPAVAPLEFVGGLAVSEAFGAFDHTIDRRKAAFRDGQDVVVGFGNYAGWPGKVLATDPDGRVRVLLQSMLGKEHEKILAESDLKEAA